MTQLALGLRPAHRCAHDVAAIRQCGREWECDEEGCLGRRDEVCQTCYALRDLGLKAPAHSTWAINRAKRDPALAAYLQRIAAIHAAMGSRTTVSR